MEHLNKKIHNYILTRFIGEGGMASVYEGTHERLGTKVAVKILNPILTANKQIRERFENEAKFMGMLKHDNIRKVLDYEEQPQLLAIIMELLDGKDLNTYIKEEGTLKPDQAIPFFCQILDAFEYAHKQGVVHRDIKPANIFIEKDNKVKILDFGIAKILGTGEEFTTTGVQIGTPVYMSPEQVRADKTIDHRSDIYSLGVTLYYALAGKPPYDVSTQSNFDIFNKIVFEPVPELKKYPEINKIIQKATAKERNERYQHAADFKKALLESMGNGTVILSEEKTLIVTGEPVFDAGKTIADKAEPLKTVVNKKASYAGEPGLNKKPDRKLYILFAGIAVIIIIAVIIGISLVNRQKLSDVIQLKKQQDSIAKAKADSAAKEDSISKANVAKESNKETPPVSQGTGYSFDYDVVYVSGGSFTMGCTDEQGSDCDNDEKPARTVSVGSFYMGKYEVTQGQWREIMGNNPSKFSSCDDCPVEKVSWKDVQEFIKKLNSKTGKTYRLPTEAEWEYAARGGNKSRGYKYSGSDNIGSVAWYDGNSGNKTHAVGQKSPNELGIYDMSGNVWEWCINWYKGYPGSNSVDYTGSFRVARGGSWYGDARRCRVSIRSSTYPDDRGSIMGLRLVLAS